KEKENKNELFIYILDESNVKNDIIEKVSKALFFRPFTVKPQKAFSVNNRKEIELGIYPRVSTWLRAFKDAKYVITDSFHGCVFSIIFNKPFIAIGNKERGMTRFISLLKIFGLENRLITNIDDLSEDLIKYNFNWNKINKIKYEWQKSSVSFIDKSLKL
ncbi:MAG: polysaccharide pyruvyl transferase family protein, partial [Bacilli bacterium]